MAENKKIETFVIISKENERERYRNFLTQVVKYKLHEILNIHYFKHCWKTDITEEIRKKYCKSDWTMRKHGRNMKDKPLTNGEISLFFNHIECLKKIRKEYSDGNFIIFESDVLFRDIFNVNIRTVLNQIPNINNWDIINIGDGTRDYMKKYMGHPKTKPIEIGNNKYYKENINCCIEGIIWNYNSICKFLNYYEQKEDIDGPIDTKMDVLSTYIGGFNIYWLEPSLVSQGSMLKIFKSTVR